jgi:hypothetical protein
MVGCAHYPAPPVWPSTPETGPVQRLGQVRATTPRSTPLGRSALRVDARLAVVQTRRVAWPQRARDTATSGEISRPIAHIEPLHLLAGWWLASCPVCGCELARGHRQDRVERKAPGSVARSASRSPESVAEQ